MTRREAIIRAIRTMDARTLYSVWDDAGRLPDLGGGRLCDLCPMRSDATGCTADMDDDCPDEVYYAWADSEVNDDDDI